mmetsp:Transcript_22124/g.77527  ORF Transcript_22124/g.77527 Transcript_22124/m.77527 type:complete len:250 (-) Transcript_22124:3099-3848(-)
MNTRRKGQHQRATGNARTATTPAMAARGPLRVIALRVRRAFGMTPARAPRQRRADQMSMRAPLLRRRLTVSVQTATRRAAGALVRARMRVKCVQGATGAIPVRARMSQRAATMNTNPRRRRRPQTGSVPRATRHAMGAADLARARARRARVATCMTAHPARLQRRRRSRRLLRLTCSSARTSTPCRKRRLMLPPSSWALVGRKSLSCGSPSLDIKARMPCPWMAEEPTKACTLMLRQALPRHWRSFPPA